jgi:serine protease
VTGVITPEALNRVDSDTNDPETAAVSNNDPDSAQAIVAPAIIGGFVAAPGTESRFGPNGEASDVYEVQLQAGQQVVLEYPDAAGVDLHLYLLDESQAAIDASLLPSESPVGPLVRHSVAATEEGRYFVDVRADSGRTNYTLRLDSTHSLTLEAQRGPRVSDEFVSGDIIVRTRPGLDGAVMPAAQGLGMRAVAGDATREQLWRMPEAAPGQILDALSVWRPTAQDLPRWASPDLRERYETLLAVKALRKRPEVIAASPNFIVRPQRLPNDPLQGLQWFHPNVALPEAWDISIGRAPDADVIVAVIDTGVFPAHEDLAGRLVSGYDFIADPAVARDGDGIDPNPEDPGDSSQPGQSSWHGTHVTGIVGAATDNETGVAGMSWGARIMPVRTLGAGGGTLYDTLQGVRYAAGLQNDSGTVPPRRADVINLSLGGGSFVQDQAELYQAIRDLGIFILAASGNSGGAVGFPAAYPAVFAVGATDAVQQRAPYSSYGNQLDFVAPGGDTRVDRTGDGFGDGILSTMVDDSSGTRRSSYAFYQGTSMATAVASGVVALARSVDPDLAPDRLTQLLKSGRLTDDILPAGWDAETGWGQINARKTLEAVRLGDGEEEVPFLSAVPARLEFGLTESVLEFSLRNSGGGSVLITGVTASHPAWLSVRPVSVDPAGLGSYRIEVARGVLADGEHRGTILVAAESLEDLSIPVLVRVAAPDLRVDTVGRIYVLLVDEEGETFAELGVDADGGRYAYRFEGVPEGNYRILAGTDMDNDRQICDPGEACGAYPILGLLERIVVDRDRSGLDFSVGFRGQPAAEALVPTRDGSAASRFAIPMRRLP